MGPWLEKFGDPCSIGMLKHRLLVWGGDWELAVLQSSPVLQKLLIPNHTWTTTVLRDKIKGHPYFTCLHFLPIKKRQSMPCRRWHQGASVMFDSVWSHRWQPTRLHRPWDSPGKNTGVGCHCLLQCMNVKSESEVTQSCSTLSDPMDCSPPGFSVLGIFQARIVEWSAIAFSESMPIPP